MSLVVFGKYYNFGEALVVHASLHAAGYQPSFHNYHHAHMSYLSLIALGGLIILIPDHQLEDARKLTKDLEDQPAQDHDPISFRKFGRWKRSIFGSFAMVIGLFPLFLFLIFVPARFLILLITILVLILAAFGSSLLGLVLIYCYLLVPISILLHAEYIAIPKLNRSRANEP